MDRTLSSAGSTELFSMVKKNVWSDELNEQAFIAQGKSSG